MVSVHHQVTGKDHGQEQSTRCAGSGRAGPRYEYHCDYLWLSADLQPALRGGGVGTMGDWIDTGLSDHVPVGLDLAM